MEKINKWSLRSIDNILGTIFCVSKAISMALLRGPKLYIQNCWYNNLPLAQEVKYKFILYISSLSVNKNIIFVLNKNYSKCIKWVNFGTFSKNNILKLTMWSLNASLANYFLYSINWLILASCNLFVSKKIKQIMLIFNKMWPKKKKN